MNNGYKIFYILASIVVIVIIAAIRLLPSNTIESAINIIGIRPLDNKTIVIDPGHGGIDGGTNRGDVLEKDINLSISLKLKDLLLKRGAKVIMTRESDDSLDDGIVGNGSRHREDLNERVKIIDDSKADIFISIHVNSIKNIQRMGPIVFYDENSEIAKSLAENVQEYLNNISTYKKKNITVKHNATTGDYYILKNTMTPGIIAEIGFISNEIDRQLLLEEEHQNEVAEQIIKSLIKYFNKKEKPFFKD